MKYELKIIHKNELVHIPCNINIHKELEGQTEYLAKLRSIRDAALHNSTRSSIFTSTVNPYFTTEPEALELLHGMGYKYACVWLDGNYPNGKEFEEELLEWLNSVNTRWLAAGHIIDRLDGDYPYWHEQIIVINLESWKKINDSSMRRHKKVFAPFYESFKGTKVAVVRADEHIHDDYTPLWINSPIVPNNTRDHDTRRYKEGFGNSMIPKSLEKSYAILNIPHGVRKLKTCLYVEDDVEYTAGWLMDYGLSSHTDIKSFKTRVSEDKKELAALKFMTNSIVYFTNTEGVPNLDRSVDYRNTSIDTCIVPCSGVFQFAWMIHHIDSIEHVIFYDVNPNSVNWMKHLVNNWDGNSTIDEIVEDYKRVYASNLKNANYIYEPKLVDDYMRKIPEDKRIDILNKLRSLGDKLEFIECNIVNNSDLIVDKVRDDSNVFLNMTNILQYESNYLNNDVLDVTCEFYKLIYNMKKKTTKFFFNGDTPRANFIGCAEINTVDGI